MAFQMFFTNPNTLFANPNLLLIRLLQLSIWLRGLRARGMNNTALQAAGHLPIDCRLQATVNASSGFIKMTDRQRVDAFLYAEARNAAILFAGPTNMPGAMRQADSMEQTV